jgi:ABC-type dipeptide/oligopeptide/nickel transport system permease component
MDRLRTSPSFLPVRTYLLCTVVALALLWSAGNTLGDGFEFLIGVLPVGLNAESMIMVLFQKALPTFVLVTLALVIGLSCALALAMLVASGGPRLSRTIGWVGRAMQGVPPMLWALGLVYIIVHGWQLPVETLFPYEPPAGMEPLMVRWGRAVWAWMLPALALAAPVFGMSLFSFTHRLNVLLKDPMIGPLKSRGLSRDTIKYRHLFPELVIHIARLARPAAAMLLAFAIPVEHVFRFEGWGTFAAEAFQNQHPLQLAAVVYLAGVMMAAWYGILNLADKHTLPPAMEHAEDEAHTQSRMCVIAGAAVALILVAFTFWAPGGEDSPWAAAARLTWREVGAALLVSSTAAVLILATGLLIPPTRWNLYLPRTGLTATLAAAPLLLLWMTLASTPAGEGRYWALFCLISAIPGAAAFHASFREKNVHALAEASFSLGRRHWGSWYDHMLLNALPSLMGWLLRNVATLLIWKGVFDYLAAFRDTPPEAPSWGKLMALESPGFFDDPAGVLAPALLLSFWGLGFRLLSRAFHTDTPPARTSPFAS